LVKFSVVPKLPDGITFQFTDTVMKNTVTIRALPPVELLIAVPCSYPSSSRPLVYIESDFYRKQGMADFLIT
jgi:hypothetical protein